jgi:transcriptional regulator with XRE-family HTH domain
MALTLVAAMPAKKPPQSEFGHRLVAIRQARGLTQTQLADAMGTTQRVISRLETVADYPTVPLLLELCRVLKVSADELLALKPPPRVEPPRQPPEEKRLWRHLRVVAQLPERDQRAVLRLIDTAAKATGVG